MRSPLLSLIVPTRNRPAQLAQTLAGLRRQDLPAADYELVVVDDGSDPPIELPASAAPCSCRLVRLEGVERSAARNAGAAAARGRVLVFLDDDMIVGSRFLEAHLSAQKEFGPVLAVGAVRLPQSILEMPFGRFRQRLEDRGAPRERGIVDLQNFCTAQNMSIHRSRFETLGGFDPAIVSAEDQDLALRHTRDGGAIAYIPEAAAIHDDWALDLASYCRRMEWGMEKLAGFYRRHPDWPENREREGVNGPLHWGREPLRTSLWKVFKAMLGRAPLQEALFLAASALEKAAPRAPVLDRTYRLLLGIHIQRGYRRGMAGNS